MNFQTQRQILTQVRMYTRRGWLVGTTRMLPGQHMMDFLEHSHRWLTFTDVQIEGYEQQVAYLSFQRAAIGAFLAPGGTQWRPRPVSDAKTKKCRVLCLFQEGAVRGHLEIPARVRVSDYFMNREGFVQLTDAHVRLPDGTGERTNETHPLAIVNTEFVVGVSEFPG